MRGLPALDYSNPIKTITAKGTYTVPEDCYLVGSILDTGSGVTGYVYINGNIVASVQGYSVINYSACSSNAELFYRVSKNDNIKITGSCIINCHLFVEK